MESNDATPENPLFRIMTPREGTSAIRHERVQFTMLDLGAGFGRWIVAGVCTVCRCFPSLRPYIIGVEDDDR
jgi:hypothetical protein